MKTRKITLQKLNDGRFQIARMTNAVRLRDPLTTQINFTVGDILTEKEVDELCACRGLEVTINDVRP